MSQPLVHGSHTPPPSRLHSSPPDPREGPAAKGLAAHSADSLSNFSALCTVCSNPLTPHPPHPPLQTLQRTLVSQLWLRVRAKFTALFVDPASSRLIDCHYLFCTWYTWKFWHRLLRLHRWVCSFSDRCTLHSFCLSSLKLISAQSLPAPPLLSCTCFPLVAAISRNLSLRFPPSDTHRTI